MAKKPQHSAAFLAVFGASLEATSGKPAGYFEKKRVREGKTQRDHRK